MSDLQALLEQFHETFDVKPYADEDVDGRRDLLQLRLRLLEEESREASDELLDALNGVGDVRLIAKELADVVFVAIGTADLLGIPFNKVFEEVARSNMSKVGDDGKPLRRADGKVLKGPNYSPANLDFVEAVL